MQSVQTAANPSDFSDLIATAFQNFVQMLKKHPDFYTAAPQQGGVDAQALLDCACFSLGLPEVLAVKNATSYLTHLVAVSVAQVWNSTRFAKDVAESMIWHFFPFPFCRLPPIPASFRSSVPLASPW